ncbi:sugar phosphate isomerase/epimerase [Mycoplasmatota bacterium]|nr:sugar phosphate isomerase/epimerase [Mycoplasmatota bacterium]
MTKLKVGLHSAILPDHSYEQVLDICSKIGYQSLEVCAWPQGKSERRYAGVSHVDVDNTDPVYINHILKEAKNKKIDLAVLGYYPNPLDPDKEKSNSYIKHIKKVIYFSHLLGIDKVSTFIGKDKDKSIEENLETFSKVWPEIIDYAASLKVYVGIENCPMYFTKDEWPGGLNLASSPAIWKKMFDIIPSKYFGLSYDPSHLSFQGMDYIKPLYEFKDRLIHIHLKDTLVNHEKLDMYGIFSYPLQYMDPKIPGLGDIDWNKFIQTIKDIKYKNNIVIEIEDKSFEGSFDDVLKGLELSLNHVKPFL